MQSVNTATQTLLRQTAPSAATHKWFLSYAKLWHEVTGPLCSPCKFSSLRWLFFFNWESHTPLHRVQKVVCLGDIVAVWVWEPGTSLSFISYYPIEFWSLTFSLQNQTIAPVTPQVGWEKQMEGAFWGGNNKIKQYLGMWNEWTQP